MENLFPISLYMEHEDKTYETNMELLVSLETKVKTKEEDKMILCDLILELKKQCIENPKDRFLVENIRLLQRYLNE
jgi:hypothetical protein|tara:strand:+ start:834 stop:1061 length:228 start_codon:yes stop_codon:yes gene_type:complete